MPTRDALIFGCCLLGLSAACAAAAAILHARHRRILSLAAAGTAAGAALLSAAVAVGQWIEGGKITASWFESILLLLAGLSAAAAWLAAGSVRRGPSGTGGVPALASAAGVALASLLGSVLALGLDDTSWYSPPAMASPFALVFVFLHPLSTGFLLSTAVPASGLLLSPSGRARPAPWDAAIRRLLHAGLPLLVIALAAEAVWHGSAWSAPWSFDLSETWPLLSVLVFVLWFHLRRAAPDRPRTASALLLAGGVVHVGYWLYCWLLPTALQSMNWFV